MITKGDSDGLEDNTFEACVGGWHMISTEQTVSIFSRKAGGWVERGQDETQREYGGRRGDLRCGNRI